MQAIEKKVSIPSDSDEDIDFIAILQNLWRRRILVVSVTAAAAVVAVSISFALPKTFTANASILPSSGSDSTGAIAAGLATQLGAAAGMLGSLGLGGGRTADLVEVLGSRSMAERVIAKYHLEQRLHGWKGHDELVAKVMKMVVVNGPNLKSKAIDVVVNAPEASLAADIANAYVGELKDMLDEIGYNSASKNRRFIELQLNKNRDDLVAAENKLISFQEKYRLVSLPETVMSSIKSISDLEAQKIAADVQTQSTEEAIGALRSKADALQVDPNALFSLEIKRKGLEAEASALDKAKSSFLDQLTNLPPKAMELARYQRDLQVQNAIYLALSQQYETAIISENKDSDAFIPLDKAEVPEHASKPKKAAFGILGLIIGLLIGTVWALSKDYFEQRVETNDEA